MRFGENLEQGCIRELREETGITEFEAIIDTQFSFTFFDDYRTQKEQVCGIRIAPDSPILLSDEHTEHRWVNYDEAIAQYLSYPGNKRALEALHRQIASRGWGRHYPRMIRVAQEPRGVAMLPILLLCLNIIG